MAIDPLSALGTAWTIGTSVARVFQWKDEDKQVDGEWLAASGFEEVCDEKGLELRWVRANRIETTKTKGYEVVLQEEDAARVRHHIVNRDTVLMGKPRD
jgi:hypothetical protein